MIVVEAITILQPKKAETSTTLITEQPFSLMEQSSEGVMFSSRDDSLRPTRSLPRSVIN
ncbi:MAG TPA: hypothetical protein VKB06_03885 [Nitrososphaera sp.]|nr:hypothetical protein [Nitrososphaera sp.]